MGGMISSKHQNIKSKVVLLMSANKGTSGAIEGLVYDFYVLAIEGILQERRGILSPLGTSTDENYSDNSDYNRQSLLPWRRDVNRLLILDLYMFSTKHNKHILLERWKINYQRNNDSRDSRPFPIINRRVLTLVRTIICFIRLLPGFNLLNLSKTKLSLGYQIYEGRNEESLPQFSYDCLKYRFNQVSTSKGFINIGVTYVNPSSTKELIRSVNNSTGQQRSNKETEKSAAIPIPINSKPIAPTVPDYNSYPTSRHRQSASYEQQRIDEYEDQFDGNNSSYSAAMAMNGHRDEDGHQRRHQQQQQADDLRRRSLQQPHGRVHSNSEEGPGLKVRANHQQALSLDHYNSKHSLLSGGQQHFPFDSSPPVSTGVLPVNNGIPSMSPSSATASVQYLQSYNRQQQVSPSVAMGAPLGGGGGRGPHPTSNSSSQSTPPFSLLDQRANENINSYPDPTKASPPYAQFSTSLVSTSPANMHPSGLAMLLGAVRTNNRRQSFSDRTNSVSNSVATSWQQQVAHAASSPENSNEELHLLVTLPRSPFLRLLSTDGDPKPFPSAPQTQSAADSNRLDVILYEEKRQQQMQQLSGWGGGLADNPSKYLFGGRGTSSVAKGSSVARDGEGCDYNDESSRQFRLSDDRRGSAALQLDFGGDVTGSEADRTSLDRAPDNDEEEEEEEEEDMMFAFALNPHEFAGNSDMNQHTPPSAPSRLLARRNSFRSSLSSANHPDAGEGQLFTAASLKEEMQTRLNVFKAFRAELR